MIVAYIDAHRTDYGVQPISRVPILAGVQLAPSTYYAVKTALVGRTVDDAGLIEQIPRVHNGNGGVFDAARSMPS